MRTLATALFSFSAAIFAAQYLVPERLRLPLGAVLLAVGLLGIFLKGRKRALIMLIALGLSSGFLWNGAYEAVFYSPAESLAGSTVPAEARVLDSPIKTDYGHRIDIRVLQDGEAPVKARLYAYDDSLGSLKPGAKISFTGKFSPADTLFGKDTDLYISNGIFLTVKSPAGMEILEEGGLSLFTLPNYLARFTQEKISEIFPERAGAFVASLILGDRTELYEDTAVITAMKITGVYHIVSVSGLHMAFLVGLITMIFGRRKRVSAMLFPVIIIYMAMTGFTPSVTRSGLMQLALLAAPLFKRESDGLTSLSVALCALLAVNPFAVRHIGLQLSFAATLGLILAGPPMYGGASRLAEGKIKSRFLKKCVNFIAASLITTVSASLFTTPIVAAHFGYVSLAAPITNLLVVWAVSMVFGLAFAAIIAGFIWTLAGKIIAWAASLPVYYIYFAVRNLAKGVFAAVYVSNPLIMIWLIYVYAVVIISVLLKAKLRQLLLPVVAAAALLCAAMVITFALPARTEGKGGTMEVTVLDVGQGQSVAIRAGGQTVLVDCGGSTGNAGDIAADYLLSAGSDKIDVLILTHFHADHANGAEQLFQRMKISLLVIPDPELDDESWLADDIINIARKNNTDIIYVTENMKISLNTAELSLHAPIGGSDLNERGVIALCSSGERDVLITGDAGSVVEKIFTAREALPKVEILVVGHHGSKNSTSIELLEETMPDIAAISVGYNFYGHPAAETLERLWDYGAIIYRTDESGTLKFTLK